MSDLTGPHDWQETAPVQSFVHVKVYNNVAGKVVWRGRAFGPDHATARCLHNHYKLGPARKCGKSLTRAMNSGKKIPRWIKVSEPGQPKWRKS